jgi:hypothetical protein
LLAMTPKHRQRQRRCAPMCHSFSLPRSVAGGAFLGSGGGPSAALRCACRALGAGGASTQRSGEHNYECLCVCRGLCDGCGARACRAGRVCRSRSRSGVAARRAACWECLLCRECLTFDETISCCVLLTHQRVVREGLGVAVCPCKHLSIELHCTRGIRAAGRTSRSQIHLLRVQFPRILRLIAANMSAKQGSTGHWCKPPARVPAACVQTPMTSHKAACPISKVMLWAWL